jgi:hypothetical protein
VKQRTKRIKQVLYTLGEPVASTFTSGAQDFFAALVYISVPDLVSHVFIQSSAYPSFLSSVLFSQS